jgi:rhodanese-related sulfurtransferase
MEKMKRPKRINAKKAKVMVDTENAILVDVRTPREFVGGHIKGAVSLPIDVIPAKAEKVLPNKETGIVVYCLSGARSGSAARMLARMGYQNIRNLGAMYKWNS